MGHQGVFNTLAGPHKGAGWTRRSAINLLSWLTHWRGIFCSVILTAKTWSDPLGPLLQRKPMQLEVGAPSRPNIPLFIL